MNGQKDCREDVINSLCLWASEHGINVQEAKFDLYMLLNNVEITSRCTEIAEVRGDRNEMLLKKFLLAKQVKGCTQRTLEFYRCSIIAVLRQIGKTVDDITADDIRIYMAIRLRRDRVTKTTVANEIRSVSSFFTWLYVEEIIKRNPMAKVDRIKQEKTKKEALTEMEIEKLRASVITEREKAIIELLLSTGCRVTEAAQILLTEIDGDRVLVHGKGQKDRYVYLNAKASLAVETYLNTRKENSPYLFPGHDKGHIGQGTIEMITRELAKRAGVEKANPHKFRRTCATMALRRGMPIEQVSKMLGHESVETTQIYLDLTEDALEQAHKKYVV